ncbi:MAG TPA: tRNA dihydrouridine synthase DusB [Acidobacteriota bacterium]|nr:tRNA dihydrouridine synthase DusB [Acidobacteriota bacterium]HQF86836.1 tRNA dihydrouridine synthase DusB [Acidobacteriota bacterium]HQG91366.1 tRNA dihydrouridine synthase DusB [Acidobacteriota bacterium]HQK88642.1 tRNA dihydrouridine synthase DusB [Acidobacteriota bacterium]
MYGSMQLGPVTVKPNVILAPMAGITDRPFRRMIRQLGGCGLTVSELLSVEAIVRRQRRTLAMMAADPVERPFAIQIYGSRPEAMADAALQAVAAGADIVDINAGCPARKVLRNHGGAYLLQDPPQLARILTAVRRAVSVPVTVKIRSGYDANRINFLEIGRLAEDSGVDAITLHPRTRTMRFSGRSDWDHIRQLKAACRVPVIGNGDILVPADAAAMFDTTGCDAVMVGRGVTRNPWLLRQTADFLETGAFAPTEPEALLELCVAVCREIIAAGPPVRIMGELKKFCSWWVHGIPAAAAHRQRIYALTEPQALLDYLAALASDSSICS